MITQLDKKKLLYYTLVHQFIHFLQLWWPWYLKCSLLLDLRQNWQVGLKHAILCHCLQKQRATITQHKNPIYSCQRESFDDCLWSKRSMNNKALNHLSYKLSSDKNCQFPLNVWVFKSQKQQCSAALSRNVEAFSVIEDRGLYWLSDIRHTMTGAPAGQTLTAVHSFMFIMDNTMPNQFSWRPGVYRRVCVCFIFPKLLILLPGTHPDFCKS